MPVPANDPQPARGSSTFQAALSSLSGHAASLVPGAGVYLGTRQVWAALLVCIAVPPALAAGHVLAEWVTLLRPAGRLRRPRRRGS